MSRFSNHKPFKKTWLNGKLFENEKLQKFSSHDSKNLSWYEGWETIELVTQ